MNKFFTLFVACNIVIWNLPAQSPKSFQIQSPDGKIILHINAVEKLSWSLRHLYTVILRPSEISMTLTSGEILGKKMKGISSKEDSVDEKIETPFYKKKTVENRFHQLVLECKGQYGIIFRAYNDGAAYRFFTRKKDSLFIRSEQTQFNFTGDDTCYLSYVRDLRGGDRFNQSFENLYTEAPISKLFTDSLAFLPVLVEIPGHKKAVFLEADLENYPGMYLLPAKSPAQGFDGLHPAYPLKEFQGGHHMLNSIVSERAPYIAKVKGNREFPWRVVVVSEKDAEHLNNHMNQKLTSHSMLKVISRIKPGKVAWDWWNDLNISHVNFKAGMNTETYRYYIDFASANKIEYIIIDEGWSNSLDIMQISPKIDLQEIIDYGKQKNVGVILWSSWYAASRNTKEAFSKYAAMGIKGFKIDFMDRDDQKMVSSLYEIAQIAADNKLVLDLHGMYKPTGLQKTFPNILNCEGVKGMENVKWTPDDDVPHYDVSIPFIRMVAGPMDYTPGAMRNATRIGFHPDGSMPMSQGTRCHQLAMYTVFEAPLQMLSDNPTAYMKEQESTEFLAKVPTTLKKQLRWMVYWENMHP